jgi:ribonuclease BN (tRNA processing enzyme)
LRIGFLGTGGAFTDFRVNYHTNALVYSASGVVMIDCGGTAVQALKELGFDPSAVGDVIVTHVHSDHVGGIEQLAWERFYAGASGPRFDTTRLLTAPDVAPGLRATLAPGVDEITLSTGDVVRGGFDVLFHLKHITPGTWNDLGDLRFRLVPVPHLVGPVVHKPSYGVEVEDAHGRVLLTSDTTLDPSILTTAPFDLIFHDCTFTPHFEGTVHTHYERLRHLAPELRRKIVLVHHTVVPTGVDTAADGFLLAAERFDHFDIRGTSVILERGGASIRLR